MDDKDREIQKTREYNYVLWTIIVVLAIMLVNLFAQQTCDNKKFVDQVSFASTLTSIILSVIAIIMSFFSNDSISSLLHKVRDVHDNIKDIPSEIKRTSINLDESVGKLISLEEDLNKIPKNLESIQSRINESLEAFKIMLDNTNKTIENIDKKTDSISSQMLYGSNKNNDEEQNDEEKVLSGDLLSNFIDKLPIAALVSIYICLSAHNKSVEFKLKDLIEFIGLQEHGEYVKAVIILFKALGLVNLKQDENNVCKVHEFNEEVKPLIEGKITTGIALKIKNKIDQYLDSNN